ncbi:hypothetical protein JNE120393_22020 [Escherichia coli]|nr:hypothetical protein JNE120393_22020 [Escherichia coli]
MDEGSLSLPPFTGYDEKSLRDYHLALRGNSLNPMIDAATPLLGMVMRLSTMNSQTMPEHLFAQVVTDVQAVEQLLQEQGYEPGVIISFRYILCTFIDEARSVTAGRTRTSGSSSHCWSISTTKPGVARKFSSCWSA